MRKLSGKKCAIIYNVDELDRCLTCPQLIYFFPVICASFLNDDYMCAATLGSTGEVRFLWLRIELTSTGWALVFYNVSQRMMGSTPHLAHMNRKMEVISLCFSIFIWRMASSQFQPRVRSNLHRERWFDSSPSDCYTSQ